MDPENRSQVASLSRNRSSERATGKLNGVRVAKTAIETVGSAVRVRDPALAPIAPQLGFQCLKRRAAVGQLTMARVPQTRRLRRRVPPSGHRLGRLRSARTAHLLGHVPTQGVALAQGRNQTASGSVSHGSRQPSGLHASGRGGGSDPGD